jgi:hypothetical protein
VPQSSIREQIDASLCECRGIVLTEEAWSIHDLEAFASDAVETTETLNDIASKMISVRGTRDSPPSGCGRRHGTPSTDRCV